MKFETPAALWGLSSLLLLVLFSLWRQAAARVIVPSIALWKKIPERNPPVRALRRPRWRFELLLQALAIAAAIAALAGPYRELSEPMPRRVALVIDTSSRLRAGDRLTRAIDQVRRLRAEQLRDDQVVVYAASPSPRRIEDPAAAVPVDVHVDLEPLLAAARSSSDHVVLFSDRPVAGAALSLLAAPADNVGIVEFTPTDHEVFIRIVNHGPAKPIPVLLEAGGSTVRETIPAGGQVWSRKGDFSKATSVRVTLDVADSFPVDDVVEATRLTDPGATVSVTGLMEPQLLKALKSVAGVALRTGAGPATVAIGVDEAPGPGDVRVWIVTPVAPLKGEAVVARHPLTTDLEKRGGELILGELPIGERGGSPLITVGGKVAAAVRGKEIRLSVDVHRWGQGLESLPIFAANLVDFGRAGASSLSVMRTGKPFPLPAGSTILRSPAGVAPSLLPDGSLVAPEVGEIAVQTPGGPRTIRANLLDERESDTAGVGRSLDWDPARPSGRVPQRAALGGLAAGASLVFLILAWIMQLRTE